MKKVTTADRLNQIMSDQNIKQVDILDLCKPYCKKFGEKLGKSILSQYVSGAVEPGQSKLSILGMALNVNEVWLMGYDVPKERDTFTPLTITSDEQKELIHIYDNLNQEGKTQLMQQARNFLKIDEYKKRAASEQDIG